MFWAIVRVELLSLWRERFLWLSLLGFMALAAYAAALGAGDSRRVRAEQTAELTEEAERLAGLVSLARAVEAGEPVRNLDDPRDPLRVGSALGRRTATLPPGPLAALAVGQRDLLPQSIVVTSDARRAGDAGEEAGDLARRVAGSFDLAFVIVYLLPLLVIALLFDVLARERESGTLALLLSQPLSLTRLTLAKAAARSLLLSLVLLGPCFALPWALGQGVSLGAAALYLLLLVGYAGFWVALCLCVNAYGKTSAGNGLLLMTTWLALVVVLPGLASVVVDAVYPSPSRVELVSRAREVTRAAEALVSEQEGDHGAAPRADAAERRVALQEQLSSQAAPVLEAFERQLGRQQALVDRLRFLTPAIITYEALTDLSGAGVQRHQHFSAQVERYHVEYQRFFFDRVRAGQRLTSADLAALPSFTREELPARVVAARVGLGTLGLFVPTLVLAAFTRRGLRRYLSSGLR
ncbi:MAG: DUF3526 domain-containing protein [Polyangiaceae bacterium]|nr:DUF3526 domain-containing protein [Polyangiaceae bacterium]